MIKNFKKSMKSFLSILLLCGVLASTACTSQGDEGAAIYNHIYKNGWSQMPPPAPGQRTFADKTGAWLL